MANPMKQQGNGRIKQPGTTTPAVAVSDGQVGLRARIVCDDTCLYELIAAALGDGWSMDDPADKAAAVEAVLQVVGGQQPRVTTELEAQFAEPTQLAHMSGFPSLGFPAAYILCKILIYYIRFLHNAS